MKRIFTCLLFTILMLAVSAQERSAFVALQAGPSFPVGKYKAKNLTEGSFAEAGFSASVEGAWFFKPWLGFGGQCGMHFHPVDVRALGYEKVKEDPFMNDVYIRSDPYRNYTFYAGLYFQKPVIQRLSATAKALGGLLYSQTPYQLYKADYFMIGEKWFEITSAGDLEASFLVGAGLKYELKDCIGFVLNAEFTFNEADFEFVNTAGQIRTDKKVIAFINLQAGIVFKL